MRRVQAGYHEGSCFLGASRTLFSSCSPAPPSPPFQPTLLVGFITGIGASCPCCPCLGGGLPAWWGLLLLMPKGDCIVASGHCVGFVFLRVKQLVIDIKLKTKFVKEVTRVGKKLP